MTAADTDVRLVPADVVAPHADFARWSAALADRGWVLARTATPDGRQEYWVCRWGMGRCLGTDPAALAAFARRVGVAL